MKDYKDQLMQNLIFYPFPSIEQFRSVVQSVKKSCNHRNQDPSKVTLQFEGTVKLHGTNAGIVLDSEGNFYAQSRSRILSLEQDNAGFYAFSHNPTIKDFLVKHLILALDTFVNEEGHGKMKAIAIYGEFAGGNIQKGVALSQVDKLFAPFGIAIYYEGQGDQPYKRVWLPTMALNDFHNEEYRIFPVSSIVDPIYLSIRFDDLELAHSSNHLGELTQQVEDCCPFVKNLTKGEVQGVGEGVVWKCVSDEFGDLIFKVKGEKHSVSKVKTLAPVSTEHLEKVQDFVEYACTENRLNQGLQVLEEQGIELSPKTTGDFIKWVCNDIIKEEQDTLLSNNLTWKNVQGAIAKKAQLFFKAKFF